MFVLSGCVEVELRDRVFGLIPETHFILTRTFHIAPARLD